MLPDSERTSLRRQLIFGSNREGSAVIKHYVAGKGFQYVDLFYKYACSLVFENGEAPLEGGNGNYCE
jgi:hypothetical protein